MGKLSSRLDRLESELFDHQGSQLGEVVAVLACLPGAPELRLGETLRRRFPRDLRARAIDALTRAWAAAARRAAAAWAESGRSFEGDDWFADQMPAYKSYLKSLGELDAKLARGGDPILAAKSIITSTFPSEVDPNGAWVEESMTRSH